MKRSEEFSVWCQGVKFGKVGSLFFPCPQQSSTETQPNAISEVSLDRSGILDVPFGPFESVDDVID